MENTTPIKTPVVLGRITTLRKKKTQLERAALASIRKLSLVGPQVEDKESQASDDSNEETDGLLSVGEKESQEHDFDPNNSCENAHNDTVLKTSPLVSPSTQGNNQNHGITTSDETLQVYPKLESHMNTSRVWSRGAGCYVMAMVPSMTVGVDFVRSESAAVSRAGRMSRKKTVDNEYSEDDPYHAARLGEASSKTLRRVDVEQKTSTGSEPEENSLITPDAPVEQTRFSFKKRKKEG
eukprot:scaffold4060_cov190-Amphora_coffeaeformis.AAC.25